MVFKHPNNEVVVLLCSLVCDGLLQDLGLHSHSVRLPTEETFHTLEDRENVTDSDTAIVVFIENVKEHYSQ